MFRWRPVRGSDIYKISDIFFFSFSRVFHILFCKISSSYKSNIPNCDEKQACTPKKLLISIIEKVFFSCQFGKMYPASKNSWTYILVILFGSVNNESVDLCLVVSRPSPPPVVSCTFICCIKPGFFYPIGLTVGRPPPLQSHSHLCTWSEERFLSFKGYHNSWDGRNRDGERSSGQTYLFYK